MELLGLFLVGKPLNILVVSAVIMIIYLIIRINRPENIRLHRSFLVLTIAWCLYAAWEWLVLFHTPEANIRVDLLIIWPILAFLSILAFIQVLRQFC